MQENWTSKTVGPKGFLSLCTFSAWQLVAYRQYTWWVHRRLVWYNCQDFNSMMRCLGTKGAFSRRRSICLQRIWLGRWGWTPTVSRWVSVKTSSEAKSMFFFSFCLQNARVFPFLLSAYVYNEWLELDKGRQIIWKNIEMSSKKCCHRFILGVWSVITCSFAGTSFFSSNVFLDNR